jgi:hypothetical protein
MSPRSPVLTSSSTDGYLHNAINIKLTEFVRQIPLISDSIDQLAHLVHRCIGWME